MGRAGRKAFLSIGKSRARKQGRRSFEVDSKRHKGGKKGRNKEERGDKREGVVEEDDWATGGAERLTATSEPWRGRGAEARAHSRGYAREEHGPLDKLADSAAIRPESLRQIGTEESSGQQATGARWLGFLARQRQGPRAPVHLDGSQS